MNIGAAPAIVLERWHYGETQFAMLFIPVIGGFVVGVMQHDLSVDAAAQHVKLLVLVNDVSLRNLIPQELAKGFGFYQSKPATAFSPVAVTPDELGDAWRDGKVHLPLVSQGAAEIAFTRAELTKFTKNLDGSPAAFYRQAKLYFPNEAALKTGTGTAAFKAVGDDLPKFADGGLTALVGHITTK